jgi:tetratricopeptide (TPR) repeat protein
MESLKTQPALTPALTSEERSQKRKLVIRDSVALLTLLAVTLILGAGTVFLFRAFSNLRADLSQRWLARGEAALRGGQPQLAVEDLRSALAYSPGQTKIEIDLAEALAGAGRIQEATSYFTTLWEAEPGSGIINLQLARLAVRQNEEAEALEKYRASIYGNWDGDGTIRRRAVRLELVEYLIGIKRFNQARNELMIAVGNAPDDPDLKLQMAALLEKAKSPGDASRLYKAVLLHAPRNLAALEGAGRTAFALGNFAQTRDYMERALATAAEASDSAQARQDLRDLLQQAVDTLLYYPSPALSDRAQAERVLRNRNLALDRLRECGVSLPGDPPAAPPSSAAQPAQLVELAAQWSAPPAAAKTTLPKLQSDPDLRQSVMRLVYATELAADRFCGAPTGDNAMLSRIAANPGAVEAQ